MTKIAAEVELSPLPSGYYLANAAATATMIRHQLGTYRRIHQPPHDRWTASIHHISFPGLGFEHRKTRKTVNRWVYARAS